MAGDGGAVLALDELQHVTGDLGVGTREQGLDLDAEQAAIMDIFGFFNDKTISADVSMRREAAC